MRCCFPGLRHFVSPVQARTPRLNSLQLIHQLPVNSSSSPSEIYNAQGINCTENLCLELMFTLWQRLACSEFFQHKKTLLRKLKLWGQNGTLIKPVAVSVISQSTATSLCPRITWFKEPLSAASFCALPLNDSVPCNAFGNRNSFYG